MTKDFGLDGRMWGKALRFRNQMITAQEKGEHLHLAWHGVIYCSKHSVCPDALHGRDVQPFTRKVGL